MVWPPFHLQCFYKAEIVTFLRQNLLTLGKLGQQCIHCFSYIFFFGKKQRQFSFTTEKHFLCTLSTSNPEQSSGKISLLTWWARLTLWRNWCPFMDWQWSYSHLQHLWEGPEKVSETLWKVLQQSGQSRNKRFCFCMFSSQFRFLFDLFNMNTHHHNTEATAKDTKLTPSMNNYK